MSPACTASGLIFRLSSCLRPSILTWTVPPPAVASTTVSCIFFCRFSYCCLACDISDWRLNPPMARSLLFVALVDDGSNLSAKFLLQPLYDRVLLRSRAAQPLAPCRREALSVSPACPARRWRSRSQGASHRRLETCRSPSPKPQ